MIRDKLITQLYGINKSGAGAAADRIEALESELDSLRDQLADFRDTVLCERGALAESGMTCDQINAVLSEFDERFVPYDQERAG
jgi:hypothetical protein